MRAAPPLTKSIASRTTSSSFSRRLPPEIGPQLLELSDDLLTSYPGFELARDGTPQTLKRLLGSKSGAILLVDGHRNLPTDIARLADRVEELVV